jgi:hypothetical protein
MTRRSGEAAKRRSGEAAKRNGRAGSVAERVPRAQAAKARRGAARRWVALV